MSNFYHDKERILGKIAHQKKIYKDLLEVVNIIKESHLFEHYHGKQISVRLFKPLNEEVRKKLSPYLKKNIRLFLTSNSYNLNKEIKIQHSDRSTYVGTLLTYINTDSISFKLATTEDSLSTSKRKLICDKTLFGIDDLIFDLEGRIKDIEKAEKEYDSMIKHYEKICNDIEEFYNYSSHITEGLYPKY